MKIPKPVLLAAALLAGCAAGRSRLPAETALRFAEPVEGNPSVSAVSLGLTTIRTGAVLVVCGKDSAALAAQVARTLEQINRDEREIVGGALRVHGLVLVRDQKELPSELRYRGWLSVDGVNSLVIATKETALPFKDDFTAYMVFPMLAHENVDDGIKAECLGGRLTSQSASSRWFVEGIADYTAYRTVVKHQSGALARFRDNYRKGLSAFSPARLDLEDSGTWWPRKASSDPSDVQYAYAAAHFAVAELAKKIPPDWISRTLRALRESGFGLATTSADFARLADPPAGKSVTSLVRGVEMEKVRRFAESL